MIYYAFFQTPFRAFCTNVFSADSVELLVDLGFRITYRVKVKLFGVQLPQMDSSDELEVENAMRVKSHLVEWLMHSPFKNVISLDEWPVQALVRQSGDEWLAQLWVHNEEGYEIAVVEKLIEMGFGLPRSKDS